MTDGNRSVTKSCPPPPTRTIDTSPPPPAPHTGRTHARRRLALLSVGLLGTTAITALVGASSDGSGAGGTEIVAMAGADQEPLEGGPDDATFSPVSVAEQAMAELADVTTTTADEGAAQPSPSTSSPSSTTSEAPTTTGDTTSTTGATSTSTSAAPTTAPPTTQAPPPPPPPPPAEPQPASSGYAYDDPRSTQVWYDLAACESGGNWAANTGNGYYGGLQFSLGSWQAVGGSGYPHEHSAETQIDMGRRLQASQGWGAWPHCSRELGLR